MNKKYKILITSDATNGIGGYSRVAAKLLEALHSDGHAVAQLGWFHDAKPFLRRPWLTYTTYKDHTHCCGRGTLIAELYQHGRVKYVGLDKNHTPISKDKDGVFCGKGVRIEHDKYGSDSINLATATFNPDIVISIGDQWMCQPAQDSQMRNSYIHIMYAAVDGQPLPRFTQLGGHYLDWQELYEKADIPVAYCNWAKDVINDMVGAECVTKVIPFGVNLSTFKNLNYELKNELRTKDRRFLSVGRGRGAVLWDVSPLGKNDFNILYVGRNIQRKNIPFMFETIRKFKDAGLEDPKRPIQFLFHSPYHDNGWNMDELLRQYDAYSWVKVNPTVRIGIGPDDNELNDIYNMSDIHFHMSSAEGWDLPALESLAAGVLTTALDYSAPPSWGRDALFLIKPAIIRQEPMTNLGRAYPDVSDAIMVLQRLYTMSKKDRITALGQGRRIAERYSWSLFRRNWIDLINGIELDNDRQKTR